MLENITLDNFKSFRHAQVELGDLTLIVGANASGKSNVRDALQLLHGIGLGYSLAEILGEKYGPGGVLVWRGIRGGVRETPFYGEKQFSVKCRFDTENVSEFPYKWVEYAITVDVSDKQFGPRVVHESLGHEDGSLWNTGAPGPFNDYPVEELIGVHFSDVGTVVTVRADRPVLGKLTQVDLVTGCSKQTLEINRFVLGMLKSIRFLDLDPDAMRRPSQPGQIILGDRGENLSSVLQAICQDEQKEQVLLGWLRSLTPMDAVDFEFKEDFTGRVLVHLVEANQNVVSAMSASDGTLRFLALIAALLSPDTGRIYFFEEFDNGIHPTRLHLLLQLVQQACRHQGIQVIGTTHNPAMLSFLDEEAREHALLVYRNEDTPDSRVRRIMSLPDIARVLEGQDLSRLHASGWLEDAAIFSEPKDNEEVAT